MNPLKTGSASRRNGLEDPAEFKVRSLGSYSQGCHLLALWRRARHISSGTSATLLYGVILKIKRWLQSALKTLKHNKNSKLLCALRARLLRLIHTANPIIDFARIFVIIWSSFLFNTWSFSVIFKISSSTSAWSWTQLPTSQYISVLESSTRNLSQDPSNFSLLIYKQRSAWQSRCFINLHWMSTWILTLLSETI